MLFTRKDGPGLHNAVGAAIVDQHPLARSIVATLGKHGLFGFIERLKTQDSRSNSRGRLYMKIASLAMSTHGASDIADLPPEAFIAWLQAHRTPDLLRWREELWGFSKAADYQCFKELALAYARYSGQDGIARLTAQARIQANGARSWESMNASPEGSNAELFKLFRAWCKTLTSAVSYHKQMIRGIADWANKHFPGVSIAQILATKDRRPSLAEYLEATCKVTETAYGRYVAQARKFAIFLDEEFRGPRRTWPLVTEADVQRSRALLIAQGLGKGKHSETTSRPLPQRLYSLTREILSEGEQGWPGRCGYFDVVVVGADGRSRKIYCPVLPKLFLSLFMIPLRVSQMKRLDSGEGDLNAFDGRTMSWRKNTSAAAGYWSRKGDERDRPRGYAHRFAGTDPVITGFFINTKRPVGHTSFPG